MLCTVVRDLCFGKFMVHPIDDPMRLHSSCGCGTMIGMRNMILLCGAPGSGKSSLIERNGLSNNAIGYDQLRALASVPNPTLDGGVSLRVSAEMDSHIVALTHELAEQRMVVGDTVIVDCINARASDRKNWSKLAHKFCYQVSIINVQGDLTDDELMARNAHRGIKKVSESIIRKNAETVRNTDFGNIPVVSEQDAMESLMHRTADFSQFRQVIVIGDVQGCGTALNDMLTRVEFDANSDHIVYLGDLFDRGIENPTVFRVVREQLDQGVATVIRGNHDEHLMAVANHWGKRQYQATRDSMQQMRENGIMNDDLAALFRDMSTCLTFTFDGVEYWASHGGVTTMGDRVDGGYRSGLLPDAFFIQGVSDRARTYRNLGDYDGAYDEALAEHHRETGIVHFHGHRGNEERGVAPYPGVYNLESDVEWEGGSLSAVVLSHGNDPRVVQVANTVTGGPKKVRASVADAQKQAQREEERKRREADVESNKGSIQFLDELCSTDPKVMRKREVVVDDELTLFAFNFTRKAFYHRLWEQAPERIRGLFVDPETGKVVARGYEKAFNVGEVEESRREFVLADFSYPVRVETKHNGFLLIVSAYKGRLLVFSKSGITAWSELGRTLLLNHLDEQQLDALTELLGKANVSLTFEVISRSVDPHLVDEGDDHLILLHAIRNARVTEFVGGLHRSIAKRFSFQTPEVTVAKNATALARAITSAENADNEGVVIFEDGNQRAVKVKSKRYHAYKQLRSVLSAIRAGREPKEPSPETRALLDTFTSRVVPQGGTIESALNAYTIIGPDGNPHLNMLMIRDLIEGHEA